MAAGLAMQDIIEKDNLFQCSKDMSSYFLDGLFSLKDLDIIISNIQQSYIQILIILIYLALHQQTIPINLIFHLRMLSSLPKLIL